MVDLRRRRFFGKAATAAQIAAVALAIPAVVQAAAPQSKLDALLSRWTAVYPRLDEEKRELLRGLLESHVVLFERIAD